MNDNTISDLEPGAFNGLTSLVELSLHENNINVIQINTFSNLRNLEQLRLYNNSLPTLHPGMFFGLESIKYLHLEGNCLTTLQADVFSHLPRPFRLGLHDHRWNDPTDNPLVCDAQLCWLKLEEQQGTIRWFRYTTDPDRNFLEPKCVNDIEWDTWICDETGNKFLFILLFHLHYWNFPIINKFGNIFMFVQ